MKTLKEKILKEYEKGNVSVIGPDGIATTTLKDFINQPADGLLYDLNRDEATILALDAARWINDLACAKVIRALKERVEELEREKEILIGKTARG